MVSIKFCALCVNTSEENYSHYHTNDAYMEWKTIIRGIGTALLVIMTGIIFCGNLLVIITLTTTTTTTRRKLRREVDIYVVSLALADFMVSILILPLTIIRQHFGYWPFRSAMLCQYYMSVNVFLCLASVLNLCCISFDRYIAVTRPLQYARAKNYPRVFYMLSATWLLSAISVFLPYFFGYQHYYSEGQCYMIYNMEFRIYTAILVYILPFVIIGYVHLIIYFIIKRQLTLRNSWLEKSETNGDFDGSVKVKTKYMRLLTSYLVEFIQNMMSFIKSAFSRLDTSRFTKSWCNKKKISKCITLKEVQVNNNSKNNNNIKAITYESPDENECNMCTIHKSVHLESENKIEEPVKMIDSSSDIFQSIDVECSRDSLCKMEDDKSNLYIIHESDSQNRGEQTHMRTSNLQRNSILRQSFEMNCKFTELRRSEFDVSSSNKFHRINETADHLSTSVITSRNISSPLEYCRIKTALLRRERRSEKTVAIIFGCFVGCWLPFLPQYLGEIMCSCIFPEYLHMTVSCLVYLNSCCNPFIYAFYNRSYANAFKRILHIGS